MKKYRIFYHHEGETGAESIHCQEIAGRARAELWMEIALICGCDIFRLDVLE